MYIKDWAKFQHFKDRRPPWIKLYRALLDDPEWHTLSPHAAKILVMLWLLAAEDESKQGQLPPIKTIAFRLRLSEKAIESACCELSHFVYQDDINVISKLRQVGPSETETETEEKPSRATDGGMWLEELKKNPAYQHINFAVELGKMDAWLALRPKRKRTKTFVLNWLNKIDPPLVLPPRKERLPL